MSYFEVSLNSVIFGVRKPGKKSYGSQSPWSAKAEKYDKRCNPLSTVTQVTSQDTTTTNLLKDRTQHATQGGTMTKLGRLKSEADELMDDRTVKPVVCPQGGARAQQFIIGDDESELDLSLRSRSFVDRVNDQVRKNENDLR